MMTWRKRKKRRRGRTLVTAKTGQKIGTKKKYMRRTYNSSVSNTFQVDINVVGI